MNEEMIQAYARLTAHEFALETVTATLLAMMPPSEADLWLAEFKSRARSFWVRDNIAVADVPATMVLQDAAEMVERFADKVSRRVGEARAG